MRSYHVPADYQQTGLDQRTDLIVTLSQTAHQWDHRVKQALNRLGNAIWQDARLMKFIPVHQFRLRQNRLPYAWMWWIEHDVPPYDRYRCAAYRVELYLNDNAQPVLQIQTGDGNHVLSGMDLDRFESLLMQVGKETPLLIYRDFGPAND